jgi:hypothetical protein
MAGQAARIRRRPVTDDDDFGLRSEKVDPAEELSALKQVESETVPI